MTIHIDYDREENEIESILGSQTKMIRTLVDFYNFPNVKSNLARSLMNVIIFGVLLNELGFPQRWRWCLKDLSNAVARSYAPTEVQKGDDLRDGDYGSNPNALVWKSTNFGTEKGKKEKQGRIKYLEISSLAAIVNHNVSKLLGKTFCLITTYLQ